MDKVITILALILFSCSIYGQDNLLKKRIYFTSKAIDNEDNNITIPFAHVFNESLHTSAISDTNGVLKIRANLSDTLVVTAVGYYPKVVILDKNKLNVNDTINTILKRRTYGIKEVSVHALGTYQQFKKKVENLDLPYTKAEELRAQLKEQSITIAKEAYTIASNKRMLEEHPNDIKIVGMPILSQQEKQLKKYKEILKKEERKAVIYAKFNKIVISELTKLEEPELTDFFVFCNFNEEFLFKATEYELGEAIKNKFAVYLAMKEETNETNDSVSD